MAIVEADVPHLRGITPPPAPGSFRWYMERSGPPVTGIVTIPLDEEGMAAKKEAEATEGEVITARLRRTSDLFGFPVVEDNELDFGPPLVFGDWAIRDRPPSM